MIWDDFLEHILPSVGGCPDHLAIDHTIKAAREFCSKTLAWNFEAREIPSARDVRLYTLQLGEDQELVRVLRLTVNGTQYEVPTGFKGRARDLGGYTATMVGGNDFVLDPAPNQDGLAILTDLAVRPTLAASQWPDDLSEYLTDIVAGAIATLCVLPNKDWTDLQVAAVNRAIFQDRINTVGLVVSRGRGRSRQHSRGAWF